MSENETILVNNLSTLIEKSTALVDHIANQSCSGLTTTLWVAGGVVAAALIAKEVKISEFRQVWINELRADIAAYICKAEKWMDSYISFNAEQDQEKKRVMADGLDNIKYGCFQVLRRIEMRFKPDDERGNALVQSLRDLLEPTKSSVLPASKSKWADLADSATAQARTLLKEEWEVTKNPLKKFIRSLSKKNNYESSMQKQKFLTVVNLVERIKDILENWFPWIVILIGTATYSVSAISAAEAVVRHQVEAIRLEQIGTAWLLFGALWTALGAHLSRKDITALDAMANQGSLDAKKIVRIFKAASNFSTFGALMITLGTVVLLYKTYLH